MNIYNGFKTMIFSDGESLQKKTIAVKGIVFYVKYFAITYPILATLAILAHLLKWDISDHKLITYGLHGFTNSAFMTAIGSKILWSLLASGLTVAIFTMLQSRITPKVKDVAAAASVLLFMLLHVTNYDLSLPLLPLAVIMCTPQLLLGITATYFRRRLGFFYGYLLHILVNFISVTGYLLNVQNVLGS